MESAIAKAIQLKYQPVALLWSNEKPQGAMQFQEGKWGCVMWLAAHAAKGKTAVADIKTFGCFGGGVGLGFGNQYKNFPGGEEGFCHFLSDGNADREGGKELAEKIKPLYDALKLTIIFCMVSATLKRLRLLKNLSKAFR